MTVVHKPNRRGADCASVKQSSNLRISDLLTDEQLARQRASAARADRVRAPTELQRFRAYAQTLYPWAQGRNVDWEELLRLYKAGESGSTSAPEDDREADSPAG